MIVCLSMYNNSLWGTCITSVKDHKAYLAVYVYLEVAI
jgi:hypothetical protein